MKIYNDSCNVGKGWRHTEEHKEGWTSGGVITPLGIVLVYAQGDKKYMHITRLDFVWNGKLYMRDFRGKRYSPRGIVTKAKQFAKEITEE